MAAHGCASMRGCHDAPVPGPRDRLCGCLQVVCTLGPKSRSVPILEELLNAGMSIARFNFSHGSHDYHQARAAPLTIKSP